MPVDYITEHGLSKIIEKKIKCVFALYSTSEDTDDPDHPSATPLQTIIVICPPSANALRNFKVSLRFGGSEILFKAMDVESGKEAEALVEI